MAFTLRTCLVNGCDILRYKDISGAYDSVSNPTGYGIPGGPSSPSAFTTLSLDIWMVGTDTAGAPDYTLDLLAGVPTPDGSGFYTWPDITLTDLGVSVITSGIAHYRVNAVFNSTDYGLSKTVFWSEDIGDQIRAKVIAQGWPCECDDTCADAIAEYNNRLIRANLLACCGQPTKSQAVVDWLTSNISNC